jgi:hypothetical protein
MLFPERCCFQHRGDRVARIDGPEQNRFIAVTSCKSAGSRVLALVIHRPTTTAACIRDQDIDAAPCLDDPSHHRFDSFVITDTGRLRWVFRPDRKGACDFDFGASPNLIDLGFGHYVGIGGKDPGDRDSTSQAGHRLTVESDTGAALAILTRPRVGKTQYGYQRMTLPAHASTARPRWSYTALSNLPAQPQ